MSKPYKNHWVWVEPIGMSPSQRRVKIVGEVANQPGRRFLWMPVIDCSSEDWLLNQLPVVKPTMKEIWAFVRRGRKNDYRYAFKLFLERYGISFV